MLGDKAQTAIMLECAQRYPQTTRPQWRALRRLDTPKGANPAFYLIKTIWKSGAGDGIGPPALRFSAGLYT